ncbi:uncharacterized protein N7483_002435 [Penicillium malachiteum]|uniref:uncharacterized protein n=1 Tax=Penicillium malachiteum TaxID=1324776 RepID=UPI002549A0E5|nr:uncharacterized protein N7483_002435 [Penicillium malachiteum]KAJ5737310.1 hypothetical protein N7483_002435 [Penicillium malachiteum]
MRKKSPLAILPPLYPPRTLPGRPGTAPDAPFVSAPPVQPLLTKSGPTGASKRLQPVHTAEPSAKRQSKWSAEEDALIIELRGSGMEWEDISCSAISCRLHYQNYLERRSEWDEDKKNKLAGLYEGFKAEMWSNVAEEMAIPWRAAEAMHWQLGEQQMARRAGVVHFSLSSHAIDPPTTRTRRASTSLTRPREISTSRAIPGHRPGLVAQLPSLEESTTGVPAYAPAAPSPPLRESMDLLDRIWEFPHQERWVHIWECLHKICPKECMNTPERLWQFD